MFAALMGAILPLGFFFLFVIIKVFSSRNKKRCYDVACDIWLSNNGNGDSWSQCRVQNWPPFKVALSASVNNIIHSNLIAQITASTVSREKDLFVMTPVIKSMESLLFVGLLWPEVMRVPLSSKQCLGKGCVSLRRMGAGRHLSWLLQLPAFWQGLF